MDSKTRDINSNFKKEIPSK